MDDVKQARRLLLYIIIGLIIIGSIILFFLMNFVYSANYPVDGFGRLKWGEHPLKEMELLDRRGDYTFYSHDGDNSVGGFNTQRVSYKFCRDSFCSVAGAVEGDYNTFVKLHDLFIAYYGPPNSYHPYYWFWFGETNIMLYYDTIDKTGYFYYYYTPPHIEIAHEREKAIEEKRKKEGKPPLKSIKYPVHNKQKIRK